MRGECVEEGDEVGEGTDVGRDGFTFEHIEDVEFGQDSASRDVLVVGSRMAVALLILMSCKKPQDSAKTQRPWE